MQHGSLHIEHAVAAIHTGAHTGLCLTSWSPRVLVAGAEDITHTACTQYSLIVIRYSATER